MGAKVFFSLERIPSRYGTGYKAKMKRRETRTAEECARLDTRLRGMPHKMMVTHCEAVLDAMFKMAAETGCICRLGEVPRFAGERRGYEAEPYYSPLWSSPLVRKGKVLGYTAEDTDLAGRLRLRDGLIDIGCYQCWIDPPGMMMIVK